FESLFHVDLSPKPRNVNIDDVVQRRASSRFLPDFPGQHVAQNDLAFVPQQKFEKFEFARRQFYRATAPGYLPRHEVHIQVGNSEPQRVGRAAAAEQSTDASQQLGERKWFDEV